MKKKFVACLLAGLMLLGAAALADGGEWHESRIGGSVRLTGYTGDYNGYVSADGLGGVAGADDGYVTVISKSATLWSKPSTGSKKVASMNHQDVALCLYDGGYEPVMQNNFYRVDYKGKTGWVNASYVVRNKLEIVLMESNVPAYVAPDRNAKKVGSLNKMTRYRVIGFYDDYYIVSFRGAACAYIPMSCRHYDSTFELLHRQAPNAAGTIQYDTPLRTGPDDSYPEIKTMKGGETFSCINEIDGWYVISYSDKNTDGEVFAFIDSDAATVTWNSGY